MVKVQGKYQHEKSENLDSYFKAIGMPYIARKMACASNPVMETFHDGGTWTIKTSSLFRTQELSFTLEEEYNEPMPNGQVLKSVTTLEGSTMNTNSQIPDGTTITRSYNFSEDGVVLTMTHGKSGVEAKRYYKRLEI